MLEKVIAKESTCTIASNDGLCSKRACLVSKCEEFVSSYALRKCEMFVSSYELHILR